MTTQIAVEDSGHECEWVSACCGADEHEYIEHMCVQCHELAPFICAICEMKLPLWEGRTEYDSDHYGNPRE